MSLMSSCHMGKASGRVEGAGGGGTGACAPRVEDLAISASNTVPIRERVRIRSPVVVVVWPVKVERHSDGIVNVHAARCAGSVTCRPARSHCRVRRRGLLAVGRIKHSRPRPLCAHPVHTSMCTCVCIVCAKLQISVSMLALGAVVVVARDDAAHAQRCAEPRPHRASQRASQRAQRQSGCSSQRGGLLQVARLAARFAGLSHRVLLLAFSSITVLYMYMYDLSTGF